MAKSIGNIPGLPPFAVYSKNYERGVPGISAVLWVEIEYDNLLIHLEKQYDSSSSPVIVTVSCDVQKCSQSIFMLNFLDYII